MSIALMTAVWESALPADERLVALALADWANDDGDSIYPSQPRLAWKVGKTDRSVRDTLASLRARGVLVAVHGAGGGRGVLVHYHMAVEMLPTRPAWKSEETSGFGAGKPGSFAQKTRKFATQTRKPTSYDPSSDPSSDPPHRKGRLRDHGFLEQVIRRD